jgi:DNA repair exonuclease SbcCD ATPase subunit
LPRKREVDQHPKKKQIINKLIKGESLRHISAQYDISFASLGRYLREKLRPQVAKSQSIQEKLTEQAFIQKIDEIEKMLRDILDEARSGEEKDNHLAIKAIAEIRKGLEFLAKIQGMIQEVNINVTQIEQWTTIKQIILDTTKDYPEVREKIVDGLAKTISD